MLNTPVPLKITLAAVVYGGLVVAVLLASPSTARESVLLLILLFLSFWHMIKNMLRMADYRFVSKESDLIQRGHTEFSAKSEGEMLMLGYIESAESSDTFEAGAREALIRAGYLPQELYDGEAAGDFEEPEDP